VHFLVSVLYSFLLQQSYHIRHDELELFFLLVLVDQSVEHQSENSHQQNQQDNCSQDATVDIYAEVGLIGEDGPERNDDHIRQNYEDPKGHYYNRRYKAKNLLGV